LELLTNTKTWYVDATFKVIKQPFTQLFSIHAFVKKDGKLLQTPLAFVVMSRRRRKDYKRVFHALIATLPRRPLVQAVVSDFEVAVWSAIRELLPGVLQRGCASEGHAMRLQRKSFPALHSRLSKYWDEYVARHSLRSSSATCLFAPLQEHDIARY